LPLRPCLDCGRLAQGPRCPDHQRGRDRVKDQTKRQRKQQVRPYTNAEKTRRAQVVADWRNTHGDVCPGWERDPHASTDLTADHVVAVGAGGAEQGPLTVLCRSCNGRKGARHA
jgi:5-methylcytosine-specific restriction protein A